MPKDLRWDRVEGTCTRRFCVISQFARLRLGVHVDYYILHGHASIPRPKFGRSRPTTLAAAPATFRLVRSQVVGREQMTIAADTGNGHGLEDAFPGEAHHISFGCSKARPRYHFSKNNIEFSELRHQLSW
jgi:hypothetical protein